MPRQSSGEKKFLDAWGDRPMPATEYPFQGGWSEEEKRCEKTPAWPRRWRFDMAWPEYMLAVEIDGKGRHQTMKGYRADCQKLNAAAAAGWTVLRFTPSDINDHAIWLVRETLWLKGLRDDPKPGEEAA